MEGAGGIHNHMSKPLNLICLSKRSLIIQIRVGILMATSSPPGASTMRTGASAPVTDRYLGGNRRA